MSKPDTFHTFAVASESDAGTRIEIGINRAIEDYGTIRTVADEDSMGGRVNYFLHLDGNDAEIVADALKAAIKSLLDYPDENPDIEDLEYVLGRVDEIREYQRHEHEQFSREEEMPLSREEATEAIREKISDLAADWNDKY